MLLVHPSFKVVVVVLCLGIVCIVCWVEVVVLAHFSFILVCIQLVPVLLNDVLMELKQEVVELLLLLGFFLGSLSDFTFAPLLHAVAEENLEDKEANIDYQDAVASFLFV